MAEKKPASEKMDVQVKFRLTDRQARELERDARKLRRGLAEHIRICCGVNSLTPSGTERGK